MPSAVLQLIPILASLVLATATVAGLLWGVWTYRRNGEAQAQALALGMLQRHLELAVAHPDLASPAEGQALDARHAWFAAHALSTAQAIWLLLGGQPAWRRAIDAIIRPQRPFLRSGGFVAADFDPGFVAHLRRVAPELRDAAPDGR